MDNRTFLSSVVGGGCLLINQFTIAEGDFTTAELASDTAEICITMATGQHSMVSPSAIQIAETGSFHIPSR